MEDWVTIKTLKAKNPAMSYREIAELLNISHHTVKAALERTEPPAYKRTPAAHPHLDPFLETHFIAGASFADFPDLLGKLKDFQGKVNARVQATIKVTAAELFGKDRESFSPLPATRYIGVKEETRKVTSDCLLSYDGSRYSVPWPFVGKHVWVRVSKGFFLEIYSQANAVLARHKLSPLRGAVVIDKAHYRMPVSIVATTEQLSRRFRESFPDHELFLEKLQAQKRFNARYHLQ